MNEVANDVYLKAAKILSSMPGSLKSPDEKISMNPPGVVLTVRKVLQWAVTTEGRKTLADKSDVRDGLLTLAVRFMK